MKPDSRIRKAITANAGSFSFIDDTVPYPYGLASIEHDLENSFIKHLIVLGGELDNNAAQGKLDQTERAMKQGYHRLERGMNFFSSAQKGAKE